MDYNQAADFQLLAHCKDDDVKAYNELFKRYSVKLYKQAVRYIPQEEVAEELMLDLLFDLWDKRHTRELSGELGAYLYRCMRNKIVDYRRRTLPQLVKLDETQLSETLIDHRKGDDLVLSADVDDVYRKALESMSPQRRRVFQLSREEQFTYAEIAQEMNLSVNTVENYVSAALEIFRKGTKEYLTLMSLLFPFFL